MANEREAIVQRMVRQSNLSQELSDLVVYCQPIPFDIESKFVFVLELFVYVHCTLNIIFNINCLPINLSHWWENVYCSMVVLFSG